MTPVPAGQGITVVWRGKPVFVRHRTPEEIKTAQAVPLSQLIDPARTGARQGRARGPGGDDRHLHASRLRAAGQQDDRPARRLRRLVCPCHGSQYDVAGRVRHGPAPANLALPPYAFTTDTKIKIG